VKEDGAEVYEVKQILAKRGSGSRLQYLVEWVGYPSWDATWEPVSALSDARDALAEFESRS
jgi:Chromo (CHRromatin Organisation MOdifier) domain